MNKQPFRPSSTKGFLACQNPFFADFLNAPHNRLEAFISSSATGYDLKLWKHVSHFYDTQLWLPRNYIFANKRAFDSLDTHAQNCLRSSALLAEAAGTARARELTGFYLEKLGESSMRVQRPGERLAVDLAKIGKIMSAE